VDMVEFAEKFMNVELAEWQKQYIRLLEKLPRDIDIRVLMDRHSRVYFYMNQNSFKELILNGETNDCKY